MKWIDAEQLAYRQMGSSPCEDCDRFKECRGGDATGICSELIEYMRKYEKLREKYERDWYNA